MKGDYTMSFFINLYNKVKPRTQPKGKNAPLFDVAPRDNTTLWYCFPSSETYIGWEREALPIGNGDMGAKIYGTIAKEHLQLNEKSLWTGSTLGVDGCDNGNAKGDQGASLHQLQKLLHDGKYEEATKKMSQLQGDELGLGAYQNFGELYAQFDGLDCKTTSYIRDLDLKTATASVSFNAKGIDYRRTFFASNPDNVIVSRFTGSKMNVTLSYACAQNGTTITAQGDTLYACGSLQGAQNPLQYFAGFRVVSDGTIVAKQDKLVITGANTIDVFSALKTNYGSTYPDYRSAIDPKDWVLTQLTNACSKGYALLFADHICDYQAIFNRVEIAIGQETPTIPTDLLLSRYQKGLPSKALEILLFHYGRYLLLSSSRQGSLPANLQGVWNARNDPQWQSDYHLNINLQMNYFPAMGANLKETMQPLFDYVNDCLVIPGRATAHKWVGVGDGDTTKATGWMAHTQNNLQGHTGTGSDWKWGWAPTAGAFILENTFEYYLFTKDIEALATDIYPAMEEHALLWSQLLVEDTKYDRLVSSPCFSPEHGPVSMGNTFDQELIWQLFANVINGAEDLLAAGKDELVNESLLATIRQQIDRLKPHQIGKWGQIKEWIEEDDWSARFHQGEEREHRHMSHLMGLYPGNHITLASKEVLDAARVSLLDRGDHGQGWSKALKIGAWARMQDGNHAHLILSELLKNNIYWNLWDTHPPFQIDGNLGSTAGVVEMLLQSHSGTIEVLPALPDVWRAKGSFKGLMARGNFEIDCSWEQGKVVSLTVRSHAGGTAVIRYNGTATTLSAEINGTYNL